MVLPISYGPLETVVVSGLPPVTSINIEVSAEKAVRVASGEFVMVGSGKVAANYLSVPVTIVASGDLMFTGYVRDVGIGKGADERTLNCGFASRTVDYVECSAVHESGEILNKDIAAIARELDSYGIGIETDGAKLPVEAIHRISVGESAFASVERRARGRRMLIHDTPEGRVKLACKPAGIHRGTLGGGIKILPGATSSFTEQGRYSETSIRGQATEGIEKQQLRPQATAKDSSVKRRRVLILPHEGEATIDRMRERAIWQARRAAGAGVTASIPVTGWRDEGGKIWQPNWLVQVEDDDLGLDGLMIIKSVNFSQSDMTMATLSLADPRALGGDNPRGKTADGYAAPGVDDAEYADE
ncbi:hypothetical protein ACO34A_03730 [Rhizobium sp. ACO-34A]|nr:hypothetical protein [Rhizobium sp. ACO-34A]ATN32910.1 hypothetical protein ACO34A_03730 [Rhizobium sp. ACO-34A]